MPTPAAPWEIAEQAILRHVLRDGTILDKVSLEPEHMSRDSHAAIWRSCQHLRRHGRTVEPAAVQVVLAAWLQDEPTRLQQAHDYVETLYSRPVAVDLDAAMEHAGTIRDYAKCRLLAAEMATIQRMAEVADLRALEAMTDLAAQVAGMGGVPVWKQWGAVVEETMDAMGARQEGRIPPAIAMGMGTLDRLEVFQPGEYVILGARTSVGKSALALRWASYAAERQVPTLYVSMEMRDTQLARRVLSARSGVPATKLRTASLTPDEWGHIHAAAEEQQDWPLWVMDRGRRDMETVSMRARQQKVRAGLGLLVIDYIQRLHMTVPKGMNRREGLGQLSSQLKDLAGELSCSVLALAQINREGDVHESGARPRLSDLKESGSLEEDADTVMLMSPQLNGKSYGQWREADPRAVLLDVAKSRDGMTRDIPLWFFTHKVHFEEAV